MYKLPPWFCTKVKVAKGGVFAGHYGMYVCMYVSTVDLEIFAVKVFSWFA